MIRRVDRSTGVITRVAGSGSYGYSGERVNPFWRMPDGGVGVLLEAGYSYLDAYLPDGRRIYGNRIFFRAENPLFTVEHLTRVDIFAGGPSMNEFVALDERLGVFGRLHRGLGDVIFTAKNTRLKLDGLGGDSDSGVQIETGDVPSFEARVLPAPLGTNGARIELGAVGTAPNLGDAHRLSGE